MDPEFDAGKPGSRGIRDLSPLEDALTAHHTRFRVGSTSRVCPLAESIAGRLLSSRARAALGTLKALSLHKDSHNLLCSPYKALSPFYQSNP